MSTSSLSLIAARKRAADRLGAKQRKQKLIALLGTVVLLVLIVVQGPKVWSSGPPAPGRGVIAGPPGPTALKAQTRAPGATSAATSAPVRSAPPTRVEGAAPARPARTPATRTRLPAAITRALQRHNVVVVSLYASDVAADGITRRESGAGARDARAGFVALNVLDRKQSEPLALETGVIEAPGTLVFRRPARLVLHLDGFADRVTVAQAVTDARS